MTLTIYRNGEQVNEITTTDKHRIYKHISVALLRKIEKTEYVTVDYGSIYINQITRIREFENTKYVYHFDGVTL